MIAFFPGKFQPPHLGHILTLKRLAREYDKIFVGITGDSPQVMPATEVAKIFAEVLEGKSFEILTIKGKLTEKTPKELKNDINSTIPNIKNFNFDVLISGNKEVIDWGLKNGLTVRFFPRAEGPFFSGTELREQMKRSD